MISTRKYTFRQGFADGKLRYKYSFPFLPDNSFFAFLSSLTPYISLRPYDTSPSPLPTHRCKPFLEWLVCLHDLGMVFTRGNNCHSFKVIKFWFTLFLFSEDQHKLGKSWLVLFSLETYTDFFFLSENVTFYFFLYFLLSLSFKFFSSSAKIFFFLVKATFKIVFYCHYFCFLKSRDLSNFLKTI